MIEIFEDAGDGVPDVDTAVRFDLGGANRVEAGEYTDSVYGTVPVYSYHAAIDFTTEAGRQYWVSIYTDLDQEECVEQNHWEWAAGTSATAASTLFNQGYEASGENDWRLGETPYVIKGIEMDLRFRV